VVVPQVMHATCRVQDVSSVHIGAILLGRLSARHAVCEPLDNGTRTEHGDLESIGSSDGDQEAHGVTLD
jgi:hypothetical protein